MTEILTIMTEILTNIGTTIEITLLDGEKSEYTGNITNWNISGFETAYTTTSTFGTTFISYSPTSQGTVTFDFKFKNYESGVDPTTDMVSLFEMNKEADNDNEYSILSDTIQTPKKITIKWTNNSNNYIKTFYNAHAFKISTKGGSEDFPTASIEFIIPAFSEAGKSNYYQSDSFSHESDWDDLMGWS